MPPNLKLLYIWYTDLIKTPLVLLAMTTADLLCDRGGFQCACLGHALSSLDMPFCSAGCVAELRGVDALSLRPLLVPDAAHSNVSTVRIRDSSFSCAA